MPLTHTPNTLGVDEVGRGCLFGPVVAAAVVLPESFPDSIYLQIKDSKKLSEQKRTTLEAYIKQYAIAYGIGSVSAEEIDQINILNATYKAMYAAIAAIPPNTYQHMYIDGNRFKTTLQTPYTCVVSGDNTYLNIAAASILAKTYRDRLVTTGCDEHPTWDVYGLRKNKGYGTKAHMEALKLHGPIPQEHRLSFAGVLPS
jgi:ribonuclease HII